MLALTEKQKDLIRSITDYEPLEDIRTRAREVLLEDKSIKNHYFVDNHLNRLNTMLINPYRDIPFEIQGMLNCFDTKSFREDRYYLSNREEELYKRIFRLKNVTDKMNELGIPYVNSAMLTGDSGTGKTTFVQFLSKKFDMPMFYINFSWLIDSKLGQSSQNIRKVFHFAREHKCILMLDEIDCIARERNKGDSCEHEFSNMTITILQELDQLRSNVILIAATNVPNLIDKAVLRRFSVIHEVTKPTFNEIKEMTEKYQKSIDMQLYNDSELEEFAKNNEGQPQSRIINSIIDKVVQKISEELLWKDY